MLLNLFAKLLVKCSLDSLVLIEDLVLILNIVFVCILHLSSILVIKHVVHSDALLADDVFANWLLELVVKLIAVLLRYKVSLDLFDDGFVAKLVQIVIANLFQRVNALLFERVPVPLTLRCPFLLEFNLVTLMRWTKLNHPFYAHIHHVPKRFLWYYSVLVRSCSVLWSRTYLSLCRLTPEPLIFQIEYIHLRHVNFLLSYIWTNYYTEERHIVLFKTLLEHGVGL